MLARLMGGGRRAAPAAAAAPRAAAPREVIVAVEEQELDALATEIVSAFEYQGFDQVRMRRFIIEHFNPAELVTAISVYCQVGNGLTRRVQRGKLANMAEAANIMREINNMGIVVKAARIDDVTLPRIAMCFPRLVGLVRLKNAALMSPRFATTTPGHLQDLCFNAWADSPAAAGCDDFIKKLSFELARAKDPTARQPDSDAKVMQFRALGRAAQERDPVGAAAMATAIRADETLGSVVRMYGYVIEQQRAAAAEPAVAAAA